MNGMAFCIQLFLYLFLVVLPESFFSIFGLLYNFSQFDISPLAENLYLPFFYHFYLPPIFLRRFFLIPLCVLMVCFFLFILFSSQKATSRSLFSLCIFLFLWFLSLAFLRWLFRFFLALVTGANSSSHCISLLWFSFSSFILQFQYFPAICSVLEFRLFITLVYSFVIFIDYFCCNVFRFISFNCYFVVIFLI